MRSRGGQKQNNSNIYSEDQTRRVLQACGINIEYEIETDYIVYCPYHSNHRTPAAEISKTTGQFYCFGCQESKNLTEFVMFISRRTFFESMRLIDSKNIEKNIVSDIDDLLKSKEKDFVEFDKDLILSLNKSALSSFRAANYFKGRGITKESVERFLLGYSEKQDMVIVPVTAPDGMYIGFVARSVEGKEFKNSTGLPKSKTMFNLSSCKRYDNVFVVESSFDAIRLEQVGAHAVATLGATVSRHQKELLKKYFRSIILVSDNDEAGRGMREKLKVYLGNSLTTADLPTEVKDVSDMSDEKLSEFASGFKDDLSYILQ